MTFKTSTVTTRMGIRDSAYRLGKLAELLTLGHSPLNDALSADMDVLAKRMMSALEDAGYQDVPPSGTARVSEGEATTITQGNKSVPGALHVDGNTFNGVTMPNATDALVSDSDAVSIQDRNSVTLKGDGIRARVSNGRLVSAYFSGLTDAISNDGNPMDLTTARGGSNVSGRVRLYVVGNVLRNVYLDGTAALQNGSAVPVVNSTGLAVESAVATVESNSVSKLTLPGTVTAFKSGFSHPVSDPAGVSTTAVSTVADGAVTSQVMPNNTAIMLSTSTYNIFDKQSNRAVGVTPTFTAGKLTSLMMPDYTAVVGQNRILFPLTWEGKAIPGGSVTMTAKLSQAGGFNPLLPKTSALISDGVTLTGTDGKSYTFAITNGALVSVTVA